jgi:TRAP-type mannitol/chloroaromatic compound transport system substrate-binding protein
MNKIGAILIAAAALAAGLAIGMRMDGSAPVQKASAPVMKAKTPKANAPVKWKLASAYPGRMVQLGLLGKNLPAKLKAISGGNIDLTFFEPKALAPPLQYFDAIAKGAIDAAWTTPGYWYGKEKALVMFSSVPFGPSAGEYLAWFYYGGGQQLMDDIYKKHGLKSIICGLIAPEASGWFRKEIKTVEDLKGLKMRFFGLGGRVMQKLGVATQLLAGGDIYPALERGTLDATEYSMPAIDYDLGFYQIAKHYYFPGWHQQSTMLELLINREKWDALSPTQQAQFRTACGDNIREGLAEGEAIQAKALTALKEKGVQIHRWSPEILAAFKTAWDEVVKEESAADATFAKVWASYDSFRKNYQIWKEHGYLK